MPLYAPVVSQMPAPHIDDIPPCNLQARHIPDRSYDMDAGVAEVNWRPASRTPSADTFKPARVQHLLRKIVAPEFERGLVLLSLLSGYQRWGDVQQQTTQVRS
jgi:hypothetical protein